MALIDPDSIQSYAYIRPCLGERVSGDCAVVQRNQHGLWLAMVDVLGHGDEANQLAVTIEHYLQAVKGDDVVTLMMELDQWLIGTRGAAIGLGFIANGSNQLNYCSIGNTRLKKYGQKELRLIAQDGIVGGNTRHPRQQQLTLTVGDTVIMTTDGISERLNLLDYPPLLSEPVAAIAYQVVHRFGKDHDDACCLAIAIAP